MGYTLTQTINWAQTFIEYAPLTAGTGSEPAFSIATMVRNTILGAPLIQPWNRNEYLISSGTPPNLVAGQQDYVFNIPDFAYLEKVSLLTADGTRGFELMDVQNRNALGIAATSAQAEPNAAAVKLYNPGSTVAIRFLSVPDQDYTGILTYQKLPIPFTFFNFQEVVVLSGVAYYLFSSLQNFPVNYFAGQNITVTGFDNPSNNGVFPCVASTNTYLILTNPAALFDVHSATGANLDWFPVPDQWMDVFNNLFLAEAMASVDDAREQVYRQRGIAALLARSEGLNEMQINAFLAQSIARGTTQQMAAQQRTQQSGQARGV
jgi:hypothetical protein